MEKQKNYVEAITYAEKALEKNPERYIAYARIGYNNEQLGNFAEAVEIITKHLGKFDDHEWMAIKCLIRCFDKLGNKEKKEEYERKLKELEEKD